MQGFGRNETEPPVCIHNSKRGPEIGCGVAPLCFSDRRCEQSETVRCGGQPEFRWEEHHLIEWHARFGDSSPRHLDTPSVRHISKRLGRIQNVVAFRILPLRVTERRRLRREPAAIEAADKVGRRTDMPDPLAMTGISINRQFKEIRAFMKSLEVTL